MSVCLYVYVWLCVRGWHTHGLLWCPWLCVIHAVLALAWTRLFVWSGGQRCGHKANQCGSRGLLSRYLVDNGTVDPLCKLLDSVDPSTIIVGLEAIGNLLQHGKQADGSSRFAEHVESCGGLDGLEALQKHDNEEIYDRTVQILKDFFSDEESVSPDCFPNGPLAWFSRDRSCCRSWRARLV